VLTIVNIAVLTDFGTIAVVRDVQPEQLLFTSTTPPPVSQEADRRFPNIEPFLPNFRVILP